MDNSNSLKGLPRKGDGPCNNAGVAPAASRVFCVAFCTVNYCCLILALIAAFNHRSLKLEPAWPGVIAISVFNVSIASLAVAFVVGFFSRTIANSRAVKIAAVAGVLAILISLTAAL